MNDWFVNPEYTIWLLVIPAAIVLIWGTWRRSHLLIRHWFGNEVRNSAGLLRAILRISALLLLFLALLGPYWGRRMEMVSRMGKEVYFLIDVSASMNAEDLRPSRLEKVKMEIKKILPQLEGDKAGLIIFTDNAYVQCPLTEDAAALAMFLDLINTDQFTNQGTNFREAMLTAVLRFEEEESDSGAVPSRSVVLISDGENFGDDYTSLVGRMKAKGIKLFPVGVGTKEGAKVPNIQNGIRSGYKTDREGDPVISKLTGEALQTLATEFGTFYHEVSEPLDNLNPVMDQLRLQTASLINKKSELTSINRYQWPLGLSALLFGVSFFLLPVRKPSGP